MCLFVILIYTAIASNDHSAMWEDDFKSLLLLQNGKNIFFFSTPCSKLDRGLVPATSLFTSQDRYTGENLQAYPLSLHRHKLGRSCAFCTPVGNTWLGTVKAADNSKIENCLSLSPDLTKHLIMCFNVQQFCGSW